MLENFLEKLVSFKTVSADLGENKKALEWCAQILKGAGFKAKYFKSNGVLSLYAFKKREKNPKILFAGHIDVVGASDAMFKLKKQPDKLIGRAVFDMKYAIACYLALAGELGKAMENVSILITTDEELGGKNGTGYFMEQGITPEFCVLPDGGKNFIFERSAKGILQLKVQSQGVSAHGSRTWEGKNALENLMAFLQDLKEEFIGEPCGDKNHRHNTLSVNSLHSGTQANLIPNTAEALVDIRVAVGFSLARIRKTIARRLRAFEGIEVLEISSADPVVIPAKNALYQKFLKLTQDATGKPTEFLDSHGTCDARYFLAKKIPTLAVRPDGGGHHTEQEWIGRKSLTTFYEILKDFVKQTA